MTASDASDIGRRGWIARLPAKPQAFAHLARLDRPVGTWLLLLPCWWGLALAGSVDLRLYLLFGIGALVMRGAGCTLNDIADRNFDGRVARTASRPLPSGRVTLVEALAFLALLLLLGLAVLLQLPPAAIALGVLSLALVATYPFMKRITWWPQFFLGLAFNWGVPMGWATVRPEPAIAPLLVYGAGILWTLGYDTIYAHQDKEDDALIGVKSTARLLGDRSRAWIAGFYAGMTLLLMAGAWIAGHRWGLLGLAIAAAMLAHQTRRVAFDRPADCLRWFKHNIRVGWVVLAGLAAEPVAARLLGW